MSFRWKFEPFLVILKIAIRLLFTACTDCRKPFSNTLWKRRKKQSIFSYFPEHYWVLEFNLFSFHTPLSEFCRSREKQVRRGVKGCLN